MADEPQSNNKEKRDDNDPIMKNIWKLMKYTQGENENKTNMPFLMPVFVQAETIEEGEDAENQARNNKKLVEVKVYMSLPKEYQIDKNDPKKKPLEPPIPSDPEIYFDVLEEFKCYVK